MKKNFPRLISAVLTLCLVLSAVAPLMLFASDGDTAKADSYVFRETFSSGSVNTSGAGSDIEKAGGFFAALGGSTYSLDNSTLKYFIASGELGAYFDVRFNGDTTKKDLTQSFVFSFWVKPDSDSFSAQFMWKDTQDGNAYEANLFRIYNGYVYSNNTATKYENAKLEANEWSLFEIAFNYDETATSDSGKTGAVTSCTCMLNGVVVDTVATSTKQNNPNYFRMARYANCNFEIDDVTVFTGTGSLINVPRTAPTSEFVYRETFSGGYANDVNAASAVTEAGGLWLCTQNGTRYDASYGTLKFTELHSKDYIDLRFNYDAGKNPAGLSHPSTRKNLKSDFTLSMWIKPATATFSSNFQWNGQGYKENGSTKWDAPFKITNGYYYIDGAKVESAKLNENEWALVEIIFHYDATATAVTGETGATTSYTFMLNGKAVASADAKVYFNNIDNFRFFGGNGGNEFELDDFTVSLGTASIASLPKSTDPVHSSEVLFKEDFANGANTNSSAASVIAAKGFFADVSNGSTFTTENGYFEYIDKYGGGGDLTDKVNEPARNNDGVYLQLWHSELGMNLSRDFVFSFKVKTQDLNSMRLYWKDHSTSTYEDTTRIEDNRFYTKHDNAKSGAAITNIVIPSHEWSLIEIVFHYDEERTSVDGQKGAFAFYSIYLNGKLVRTVSTNYDFHTINDFKLFTYYSDEFAVDDFTITAANRSLASGTDARGWDDKVYFIEKEPVTDYDYSFAVVGDPQCLSGWNPDPLYKMYQWIADNAEAKNLQLVMGVGDIVHYDDGRVGSKDNLTEWERSLAAISKLNGKVTYTLARGNHDKIATYNNFVFNMLGSAYTDQFTEANGGGFYAPDKAETFYKKLEVGNDKWLIVGLDFGPTDDELTWIGSIIEANPDYKVIITTHAYLSSNGELLDINEAGCATSDSNAGVGANNADGIWEKLGKKYANISMIISGHIGADYVVKSTQVGDNGNTVTQLLVDFQQLDDMKFNGTSGVGMVTMLYFKEGEVTVEVEAYSTTQESYFLEENQYKFNLDGTPVEGEEDEAEKPELPTVIFKEDFSGTTINTSGNSANIEKAGGFMAAISDGTYSLDNNTLNYTTIAGDPYFDVRFNATTTKKDLARDFVISFWIKPESDSLNLQFHWKDTDDGNTWETNLFRIFGGYIHYNGTTKKYENAKLNANEWALIEFVFNYDETATSVTGKTGAVTSCTFMLNGVVVDTVATANKTHNLNYFRMARYSNSPMQLDDIIFATGNKSLINTISPYPSAKDFVAPEEPTPDDKLPEILYKEDFADEIAVNNTAEEKGFWLNGTDNGSVISFDDETLAYTTKVSGDYFDLRYYTEATYIDLTDDFVLSMWLKPLSDSFGFALTFRDRYIDGQFSGTAPQSPESPFKIVKNCVQINGTDYKDAYLPANAWSLIEVVFHYTEGANSATGNGTGGFTSYTFMLNGEVIATVDASTVFYNIDHFRFQQYSSTPFAIDDIIIASTQESLISTLSPAPTENTFIKFHEDFEDAVNTSGSESGCISNNGFFNCIDKGSQYVIEDGVIKYITRMSSDYSDIRFYYDATRQNLAQDFILSFKIKPDRASLSMDLSWRDRDHSSWETIELTCGRFVVNGVTYTEASIPANVWSLVEIAFHFDKNATAVTGEKGAITSYTLMLNGKAIATVDAKIDFNNIDSFRLFRYCSAEYEMDDLIVARGNESLDDGSFADWTPREYYYTDKEPVTDYDYSFAIVGDTQKVTKHYPAKLTKIYDWLLANKDSKNIQFVFGLGDITDTDSTAEWQVAQDAIFKLNGQIPYSLVRGNHDGSEGINTWFYVDEYTSQFEGFFGEGSMENSWKLLDAGSDKYLLITLDFGPTDAELEWAGRIIEAYPDRKVIITTHTYLEPNGKPVDQYYSHAPSVYDETSNDGDDIWNKLGKKYANVFLILSGHISSDYIITAQSVGDNGNVVTQMLIDPQTVDSAIGPSGMVTMLYFKNGEPTVQVETLSTIEEKFFIRENQFSIELEDWSAETPSTDLSIVSTFLNLTADINVYFRTLVAQGYENPYMVFELDGKTYTVTDYYIDANGLYCFAFKDIAPQYMGDSITATLYATKDGNTVSVSDSSYSIRAYCIYLLENYDDAETVALVSDLLVYGAKAQLFAGYKTDALVTDGIELEATVFTEIDASKDIFSLSGSKSDKAGWCAAGLYLKNDMDLRFIFTAQSLEGLTVEITVNGKTTVYGASDIVADSQGRYVVYFDGMMADELDTAVTAVLKLNGEQVGQTLTYSVASYVYHMQNSDNTALAELLKAIYNYGCSAKKYTDK